MVKKGRRSPIAVAAYTRSACTSRCVALMNAAITDGSPRRARTAHLSTRRGCLPGGHGDGGRVQGAGGLKLDEHSVVATFGQLSVHGESGSAVITGRGTVGVQVSEREVALVDRGDVGIGVEIWLQIGDGLPVLGDGDHQRALAPGGEGT